MKTPTDYYNEGIELKEKGDFEKSAEYHLKVIELDPETNMPEAWHNAGAALIRINRNTEAIPYLEKAIYYYDLAIEEIPAEKDYYLFWKSCVYALLADKKNMLSVLSDCLTLNDAYAKEAKYEEDFKNYVNDPDFRNLIDPVIEMIAQLTFQGAMLSFRGASLSQKDLTANQLIIRECFIERLLKINWITEPPTDLFSIDSISPQAMMQYDYNPNYEMHLSLHIDTNLIFYEMNHYMDSSKNFMFRFYYEEDTLDLASITEHFSQYQDQIDVANCGSFLKGLTPFFKEVELETLDKRVKLIHKQ